MNRHARTIIWKLVVLLTVATCTSAFGEYDIDWYTVSSGGFVAGAGGSFELDGTIGQACAGEMQGGTITLTGGFIAGILSDGGPPDCDPPSTAVCPNADVNCDDVADGFDIAVTRNGVNWLMPTSAAAQPRADVNRDGIIDGFDIAQIRIGACWLQ